MIHAISHHLLIISFVSATDYFKDACSHSKNQNILSGKLKRFLFISFLIRHFKSWLKFQFVQNADLSFCDLQNVYSDTFTFEHEYILKIGSSEPCSKVPKMLLNFYVFYI